MSDLVTFIRARLDEKAAGAWAVHDVSKCDALLYEEDMGAAAARDPHCDCGWPARVLREVEAMRAIVDLHQPEWADYIDADHEDRTSVDCSTCRARGVPDNWPCPAMRALASIWRDHEDYDPAWRPGDG